MDPVMEEAGLTSFTKLAAARPLPTAAQSRSARQACPVAVQGGRVIPCQVICEFALSLKGDCGELFEPTKTGTCNCMQLLCIFTVCQHRFC